MVSQLLANTKLLNVDTSVASERELLKGFEKCKLFKLLFLLLSDGFSDLHW